MLLFLEGRKRYYPKNKSTVIIKSKVEGTIQEGKEDAIILGYAVLHPIHYPKIAKLIRKFIDSFIQYIQNYL